MKTKIIIASAMLTAFSSAQNVTLAEWDIRYNQTLNSTNQTPTTPGNMVADYTADCINNTLLDHTGGWSGQVGDSEDSSGTVTPNESRCFGGWSDTLDTSKYVSFQLSFAAPAYGSINAINLDIKNYTATDPSKFAVRLYDSNNTIVGASVVPSGDTISQNWQDYTLNFVSLNGGATSTVGSVDTYEARIYAFDTGSAVSKRIGLDHVRILGDVNCVPEPSSVLLSALGSLVLLRRRR